MAADSFEYEVARGLEIRPIRMTTPARVAWPVGGAR